MTDNRNEAWAQALAQAIQARDPRAASALLSVDEMDLSMLMLPPPDSPDDDPDEDFMDGAQPAIEVAAIRVAQALMQRHGLTFEQAHDLVIKLARFHVIIDESDVR